MSAKQRLPLLVALLGGLLGAFPALATAAPTRVEHGEAEMVSETDAIIPGRTFTLAVRLQPDAAWFTEWRGCSLEWTLPEGFTVAHLEEPAPDSERSDRVSSRQVHGHGGEILLLVDITAPTSLEPGSKVKIAAAGSWTLWQKEQDGAEVEVELALELPVAVDGVLATNWATPIRRTRDSLPVRLPGLSVKGYREDQRLTLVIDADRDLNSENEKFEFLEESGQLETGFNFTAWRTARQVRFVLREADTDPKPQRLAGLLRAKAGWFANGAAFHVTEFAVVDGPPPAPVALPSLASAVMRSLLETRGYRDLRALYLHRRTQGGEAWVNSSYGQRLLTTLKQLRATAASAAILESAQPGGERDAGFRRTNGCIARFNPIVSRVETDEFYLATFAEVLARYIINDARGDGLLLEPAMAPAAQEAVKQGIAAAREQNYVEALRCFELARSTPYSTEEYPHRPPAPEIFLNLGLTEARLPGHELRAVAWLGAYLTADPYSPMPDQADVLAQIHLLLAKNRENLASWFEAVEDAAGRFGNDYQGVTLFQTTILWAEAGELAAAQKCAGRIPVGKDESAFSLHEVAKAQLAAGDIAGAQTGAALIKARMELAAAPVRAGTSYAGARTEFSFTLAQVLREIAEAQIAAGDIAAAKTTLTEARAIAGLVRYATYESSLLPDIAEAWVHAGDPNEARFLLEQAWRTVDGNPETDGKAGHLLEIGRVLLVAREAAGAEKMFAEAARVAAAQNRPELAPELAVARAEGGDVAGAQVTMERITDESGLDSARLALMAAQLKRGDLAGAEKTELAIKGVYAKGRARLLLVQANPKRGGALDDWLAVLAETDRIQDCPLHDPLFTDLAGELKSRNRSDDPSQLFESLRGIAQTQTSARNTILGMVEKLVKQR